MASYRHSMMSLSQLRECSVSKCPKVRYKSITCSKNGGFYGVMTYTVKCMILLRKYVDFWPFITIR